MTWRAIVALLAGAACAWPLAAQRAAAQDYPNRPITLVVPFPPGGGTDAMARTAAERMSKSLGQQVVVDNRGGAGGTVGTRAVAKAAADGYTILLAYTGTFAINPTLYPNAGYDPRKDFSPIGSIGTLSSVLVVHPSLPVHSVPELIAYAKAQPGKIDYAFVPGTVGHITTELFANAAGIDITRIPYKGNGPALGDLVGGHVSMMFLSILPIIGHVRGGSLRALAVTAAERSPLLPDLPTVAEAGPLPGYEAVLHYGIVAPAGTPQPIVDKLAAAMTTAMAESDVREKIAADGAEVMGMTPAEYAADIDREETKWSKVVKLSGAKVE